jgi:hypothetical protein
MGELYDRAAEEDYKLGFKEKKTWVLGFYGRKARHAFYGEREGLWMLQLSHDAAQPGLLLAGHGGHATRLDIQVTVRLVPKMVPTFLEAVETLAQVPNGGRGAQPDVVGVRKNSEFQTVYIGSRKSDTFLRCYDKFKESKEEVYLDCVRLECELKGKMAEAVWGQLSKVDNPGATSIGILLYLLERRNISTSWIPTDWSYVRPEPRQKTKEEATVGWLATQVAPSVRQHVSEWGFFKSFHALYANCLTEAEFTAIMNAWSVIFN